MEGFRYHNTNCFLLESRKDGRLLALDAGWPGTLREYQRELKRLGCGFDRLAWAMATHFHMDHAGLVGEFLDLGIGCFAFEGQAEAIDAMELTIGKNCGDYLRIDKSRLTPLRAADSRELLASLGFGAEVISTGGHSPDSVVIITEEGEAVVGDLPPLGQIMPDDEATLAIWERIRKLGARRAYPAHAPAFDL